MLRALAAALIAMVMALFAASAARAAPPLDAYGKLPSINAMRIAPSGQRLAYLLATPNGPRVVVTTPEGAIVAAADLGAVKAHGLTWASDDYVIVFTSATIDMGMDWTVRKQELGSAVVLNANTRQGFGVFLGAQKRVAQTVAGYYGSAQVDGHTYGYFGAFTYEQIGRMGDGRGKQLKLSDEGRVYPDLYRVDLETGAFELAATGKPETVDWLVGPDGVVAATLLYQRKTGDWRLMNGAGDRIADGVDLLAGVGIVGFGRTAGSLVLTTGEEENNALQDISLATGARTMLDRREAGEMLFDQNTKLWIGSLRNEGADMSMFVPAHQARLRAAMQAFPDYVTRLRSFSADFKRMLVFTEAKDDSGTFWLVDIDTRALKPLARAYPTIKAADVGPVRWVDYKAGDGLPLRGVLTLPPAAANKTNLPLVVMPHGGPWASDEPSFDYWAQAFASRGYAVFQPNFRGSDSTDALYQAGKGEWGRKMQTDISDGVAELARQGIVDAKRACIVGASYGGYAALAGVTVQRGVYRCAMAYAGVFDLDDQLTYIRQGGGSSGPGTRMWQAYIGDGAKAAISPASLADRADAPVLLMHGQDDTVVRLAQSKEMEGALRGAGKPVELVVLPGADHWLLQEDSRVKMVQASVDFVVKHNPP